MKPIVRQVTSSLGVAGGVAGQGTRHVAGRFMDLFVPWRWSQGIISDMLNAEDDAREELTKAFVETTLSGLEAIGLTSGLVALVISSAFSWYNVQQCHWSTKALWYSGLVFAFTAISAAGLCSGALLRLRCHLNGPDRIRETLGYQSPQDQDPFRWRPRAFQPWIWGTPGVLLKLSLLFFLAGLAVDLWFSAVDAGLKWTTEELKIAVFVTFAAGFAVVLYGVTVICLFYKTVHHEGGKSGRL